MPAAGVARAVNPFKGTALSVEELQTALEASRLQTAALEEQLKQTTLTSEIQTVPLRKAAEAAQARTSVRTEELKLEATEKAAKDAAKAAAAEKEAERAAKAAAKSSKKKGKSGAAEAEGDQAAAPPPVIVPKAQVLSVMNIGGKLSAVLDFDGNTMVVENGTQTPRGVANIVDEHTVSLGGQTYKLSGSTLSRFTRSESSQQGLGPVGTSVPVSNTAAAGFGTPGTPLTFPASTTGVPPSARAGGVTLSPTTNTSGAGTPARLPPLQLPPGMTVLPPTGK